jgi:hypothetical protein
VLDSQAKRSPKCKIQQVYRWQIFCLSFESWFDFPAKRTPNFKHQQVYRWHFFCLLSAQVLASQAKSSPKCTNQQVYRWQILRLSSAGVLDSRATRSPKWKKTASLPSAIFLLDYRSHDCLILKLKENPSEKNRKLPVAIFIVYRLHKRLRKRWIRKHNQLQQSASLPVAFFCLSCV